jgi:hypothetical protein
LRRRTDAPPESILKEAVMPNRLYVPPTPLVPYPNGLLSVADITEGDGKWLTGVDYESDACGADLNIANLLCAAPSGTNEVQTVTITGAPTGGTFTLTVAGETTVPIARNASAATVQAALEGLTIYQPGDVVVTGTAPAFTLTYGGAYAATNVEQPTAAHTFTGGTTPGVTVATTTPGVRTSKISTENSATSSADVFTLYSLRSCRGIGDFDRAGERANNLLQAGEQRGVEKSLWSIMNAGGATDLTIGGAGVKPEVGLAVLEYWAAQRYGGTPVIHAPRDIGSLLATRNAIERRGNHMETQLGAPVASGGGYAKTGIGGAAAPAGEAWMFVTGAVRMWRGVANLKGPFFVQTPMDNTQVAMAERSYLLATDCLLAAIRVTLS